MGKGGSVSSQPVPEHGREKSIAIVLLQWAAVDFRKR